MSWRLRVTALGAALPDFGVPPAPGAPAPTPPAPPAPAPAVQQITLTQEQLTALAAREKHQGQQSATRDLLARLGVATVDEAAAALTAARETQQAHLTDQQRAAADATAAKTAADQVLAEVRAMALSARVERALVAAGVPVVKADGTPNGEGLAAVARMVQVDPGADDTAIGAAVEALRATFPPLFAAATPVAPPAPPASDPGRGPAAPPAAGGAPPAQGGSAWGGRGSAELARRYPAKTG